MTTTDPAVTLVPLGDGRWHGTWVPQDESSSQVEVVVEALAPESSVPSRFGTTVRLTGSDTRVTPTVNAGGVVNAAGFTSPQIVAPGEIVSVFGARMAVETAGAGSLPLKTTLGTTTVRLGEVELPLYFASPDQINAVIPFEIPLGVHQLTVQVGDHVSTPSRNVLIVAK